MIKGLKICGVSDTKTLNYILNHPYPPKFIGFITNYKKSKRYVEYENLKNLVNINKNQSNFYVSNHNKINSFKNIHSVFPDLISRLCNKNGTALIHLSALGLEQAKDSKYAKSKLEGEKFIKKNFEYVGENFTYKARSIHYDKKKPKKGIYGSASLKDVKELREEGIETEIIPWIEDDKN